MLFTVAEIYPIISQGKHKYHRRQTNTHVCRRGKDTEIALSTLYAGTIYIYLGVGWGEGGGSFSS